MDFLFNDLSLRGQFQDVSSFRAAIKIIMATRAVAKRYGFEVFCHRGLGQALVTPTMIMAQFAVQLAPEERSSLLSWISRGGPFWDDDRQHLGDEYLECGGAVVTDSAVGEAAFCGFHGLSRRLLSLDPSAWLYTPIPVSWLQENHPHQAIEIANYWNTHGLELELQSAAPPIVSWAGLETYAKATFLKLTLLDVAFHPLRGQPFVQGAADRILVLLNTLNTLKGSFNPDGSWNEIGNKIYREHFNNLKAWFGDSSDGDVAKYGQEMTFPHPEIAGKTLFCPWHGKVKSPQIRIHFSYPIRKDEPLYIAYVGPKIAKW